MATVDIDQSNVSHQYFNAAEQQRLLDEDSQAFAGVTGILMFLVSAGLVLGIVSVALIFALRV